MDTELDGVDAGLNAAVRARDFADALGDPALIVPAVGQFGLIAMRGGHLGKAVEAFSSIHGILDAGEAEDKFAVLLNLGSACMYLGRLAEGRTALRDATALARAAGLELGAFMAQHNLAYLEYLSGNLPAALSNMEATANFDAGGPIGVVLLDRARILAEAGLTSEADSTLLLAAAVLRRSRLGQDLGETELERARCALTSGDIPAARRLAGQARTRFARRGSERWRQSAELVLLQADLAAGRPGRRLIPPARRLRDQFTAEGLTVQARTATLIAAEAAMSVGDQGDAQAEIALLGRDSKRDPISFRLHAAYVRARLDAARGQRARGATRIRHGLDELAAYQASFGSLDLSTAAAVHGRRLAALDQDLAIESGRPELIFDSAERGRAVTSRLTPVRPPEDPATAGLLAELRQTVESLRSVELDAAQSAPLTRRRQELEMQIAQRAWSRRGGATVASTATLTQTRQRCCDHTLATFVISADDVGAVVVDDSQLVYVPLAARAEIVEIIRRVRADLDVLAQPNLPDPIRVAVRASFARSAAAIDDNLIRPLRLERRVVLSTTGLLGQVPWSALPSLRDVPVEVVPSATAWLRARAVGKRDGGRRLVSIAGPGLDRSTAEAEEVATAWKLRSSIGGAGATGAALAKAMASARVVHVAAHGTHQNENPLFSSIRLADGPLFAHELDQTAGTPEHVVLSACELGLATIRPGDEALGLTSVLLRLGTRSVVAGVARIGDDVAADAMSAYHARLARGVDSATALAEVAALSDRPLPLVNFGASWSVR